MARNSDTIKKNCLGENAFMDSFLRHEIYRQGFSKFLFFLLAGSKNERYCSKIVSTTKGRGSVAIDRKRDKERKVDTKTLRTSRRSLRSPVATSHHPVASVGFSAMTSIGMTQGKRKRANEPRSALIVTSSQR